MSLFGDLLRHMRGRHSVYRVSPLYCIFCNDEVIISDIVDVISALYPPLCVARQAQSER
jgi:hypothetical protein